MTEKDLDYDGFLDKYAGFSLYQVLFCLGAFVLVLTSSTTHQIAIYLSAVSDFRCNIPSLDETNCNLTENQIKNFTIPVNNEIYDQCLRYDINVTSCKDIPEIFPDTRTITCDQGYYYNYDLYGETTITLWNLVCDRRILDVIATSLFFVGYFIGSWTFGPFSDWYGRKLPLFVYCLSYVAVGIGIAFIPIFEVYVFLRVLAGAAAVGCYVAGYTYVNEIVPAKYRTFISFMCASSSTVGHILVPCFAYALKNWRWLQFVCSAIALAFVPMYIFLKESPRWLLVMKREDEAKKILKKFVKSNKQIFHDDEWDVVLSVEREKFYKNKSETKYTLVDLFKPDKMRIISIAVAYNWFTSSLVYSGLSLNVGNLSGNPYLNALINAAIEILGNAIVLIPLIKKHILLSVTFLLAGLFCLTSTVCIELANGIQELSTFGVALAVIGKCAITGSFLLAYSTTNDLYPTTIRLMGYSSIIMFLYLGILAFLANGTAISLGSMSARVGNIFTPFIIEAQNQIPWLTQTIFGCLSVLAFFSSVVLPESNSDTCLTSMEEAEKYYKEKMSLWNKITKVDIEDKRNKERKADSGSYTSETMERTAL